MAKQADVIFLALPHGVAAEFAVPLLKLGCRIIDLSADFRLKDAALYKEFYGHDHPAPELLAKSVYGLPEVYRKEIKAASLIASPGCYPTSILLPTLPLLRVGLIQSHSIIADSLSGVSGAGRKAELDTCSASATKASGRTRAKAPASLRSNSQCRRVSRSVYAALIPGSGILTTLYLARRTSATRGQRMGEITACCESAYGNEPFVRLLNGNRCPTPKT